MLTIDINVLKAKPHFQVLDGLRGTAALAIVIFHFMEFVYADYSKNFIGHGFLAVDFFFCLSGFVVGYAYDDRIKEMGVVEFFKSRLIRLHPLVVIGSILGLLGYLVDPFLDHSYGGGKLLLIFLSSIFMVPLPSMAERGFALFGLNSPSWSLFFEYVANVFYAVVLYKISTGYLRILTLFAAIALCVVSFRAGSLIGGWGGSTFWDGCARISYSFLAGLLVYRSQWIIKTKLGFGSLSVLLLLAFVMPYFKWNWLAESLVVILYFPLIIALGAGSLQAATYDKLCVFLGDISYPLYMTHIAWLWYFGHYYRSHTMGMAQLGFIIVTATAFLVGVAYLAMRLYDVPIRRYLTERRGVI